MPPLDPFFFYGGEEDKLASVSFYYNQEFWLIQVIKEENWPKSNTLMFAGR